MIAERAKVEEKISALELEISDLITEWERDGISEAMKLSIGEKIINLGKSMTALEQEAAQGNALDHLRLISST